MKQVLSLIFTFVFSSFLMGQSILDIPATDSEGNPIINVLDKYVVADTNASGEQLHDIYRLQRGETYYYNAAAVFKNPITLIADEPGTTSETKPPKIILTTDDEGSVPEEYIIITFADLTIKNIAFTTTTVEDEYSWANAILLQADGLRIEFEGCIFELIGWGMIEAPVDNTIFVLNKCIVRNGTVLPDGDDWCPFFLEIDTGTIDTAIIRNNTFFNIQGSVINIEGQNAVKYLFFDHNTLVNVVRGFSSVINAHLNSTITNNIFYNINTLGDIKSEVYTGSGDQVVSGIISADTLSGNTPSSSTVTPLMPEANRRMVVKSNVYYYSPEVQDYFTEVADTIEAPLFLDTRIQTMLADDVTWPYFEADNNVNADPGFANFGGTDLMVYQMRNYRSSNATFGFWGWDPDSALDPVYHWSNLQWPLPENFSYSGSFTSTDGFHVGSLQWYPSELAQYNPSTGVEDTDGLSIPLTFTLGQNYPNPFNPSTTIEFGIKTAGNYSIKIFNILGERVADIVNQEFVPGNYKVSWDASMLSSGMYFYQLNGNNVNLTKKMMLIK